MKSNNPYKPYLTDEEKNPKSVDEHLVALAIIVGFLLLTTIFGLII